jgi:hypothetical protein
MSDNGDSGRFGGGSVETIVANALLSRMEMIRSALDPRRDLNSECGYPPYIDAQMYQEMYDREPIAARVVEVLAEESWQVQPVVYEDEDEEVTTEFEDGLKTLGRQLQGEYSYFQDDIGSPIWSALSTADKLSGIGQFGIVLLGLDDGKDLSEPAEFIASPRGVNGQVANRRPAPKKRPKLLFLRVFPESLVQVSRFEQDFASPRWGQPLEYNITFSNPSGQWTQQGVPTMSSLVHWSRVVHISDYEVYSIPRMQQVFNRLLDTRKLYGGSAEMYWKGAFAGFALTTHPQLGNDVNIDPGKLRDMMEAYMNGLQRYLTLMGMSAQSLAPQVVDPGSQIAVQLEAICIKLGCPIRIFKGSERGELASGQDDVAWNDRLKKRQNSYITPRVICPFIDRVIALGVLAQPEGYSVWWPDLTSRSEQEIAQTSLTRTSAIGQYVSGTLDVQMTPLDFWTKIMKFPKEEAAAIVDGAEARAEEKRKEEEAKQAQQMAQQTALLQEQQKLEKAKADSAAVSTPAAAGTDQVPPVSKAVVQRKDTGLVAQQLARFIINFDPQQKRDKAGRFAAVIGAAKSIAGKIGHAEHVAKAFAADKIAAALLKLPEPVQKVVVGAFKLTKVGATVAFVTWTAGQALAEKVAVARGSTPEEARRLRGVLSTLDVTTFKPLTLGMHMAGIHGSTLGVVSMIPPATAGYLAYSTARNPIKTMRAASSLVRDTIIGVGLRSGRMLGLHEWALNEDAAELTADALEVHEYDDWYIALLSAALNETEDLRAAIAVADRVYDEHPEDDSEPADDDVKAVFGVDEEELSRVVSELPEETLNFNPQQARDKGGRWAKGLGAGGPGPGHPDAPHEGRGIEGEPHTPPPPGKVYKPDVEKDHNGDGVTDFARIGVDAMSTPPPPSVGKLPNLTPHERQVEEKFIDAFHKDPDGMASQFRDIVGRTTKPGEAPTFGTDDAKVLADVWSHPDPGIRAVNRATLNNPLHQTANAIAKRAFIQHLDTLKPGDELMVTVGGCGAGKGFALKNVPEALAMKGRSKAVWDSAGDQNATENPWIQKAAEARGLKVNYVYVHADPHTQWAHPERGVVKRAADPSDGRMVDAKVFADSYALGAKNHQAFYDRHKDNPNASFVFLANTGKPTLIPGVPKESLKLDRRELAKFASRAVRDSGAPAHVKRGATVGERIWVE